MKRISFSLAAAAALAFPASADYQKGSHTLSLMAAGAGYSDDMDVTATNTLRSEGGAAGLQYVYFLSGTPAIAVGVDLAGVTIEDEADSSLVSGSRSEAETHTGLYQVVAKLAYPKGMFRPYVLGGVGASRTMLQAHLPNGPTLFDTDVTGFAGTAAVGFDFFIGSRFFLGSEWRQVFLSQRLHEPSAQGRALGVQPVRDPGGMGMLQLRIGWKFGK